MPTERTAEQLLRLKVGQQVRNLRNKRRMTQAQLGELTNREQATISRLESGDYPALTIAAIIDLAYALECAPSDILDWPIGIMQIAAHDTGRVRAEAVAS